jgi:dTDP-glucose pyrophosphorylase
VESMENHRFEKNIIPESLSIRDAMQALNDVKTREYLTLFVVNASGQLAGTLTDGDIRRGLLAGEQIGNNVGKIMRRNYRSLKRNFTLDDIDRLRHDGIELVPVLNERNEILRIIYLSEKKSVLPVDVFMLAGGEGKRLRPLTAETPKSLLKVGDKPIIEHNLDRLRDYGIDNVFLSVNYLADKIRGYLSNGEDRGMKFSYVHEKTPLGTIGSITLVEGFEHDTILVMNSDLLTNIDFEDFYRTFLKSDADMAVAGVPYKVDIPYAIMEVNDEKVVSFKEKPTYTYYSNAGIYLIKRKLLDLLPKEGFFNATDLMEEVLRRKNHLIYYPILGYWLDIGHHSDFERAQEDIKHIKL